MEDAFSTSNVISAVEMEILVAKLSLIVKKCKLNRSPAGQMFFKKILTLPMQ